MRGLVRVWLPDRTRGALRRATRRLRARLHRGDRVRCPCCGGRFDRFLAFGLSSDGTRREAAQCPGCGSMERHRLLWLYLKERTDFFEGPKRLLHVAPEEVFHGAISRRSDVDYVTADLNSPLARDRVDVEALPYPDASFDVILCNHVLEHVPDDRRAMAELFRVLRPGGWAILQVPYQSGRERTFEDASIRTPAARKRAFGQGDHLRIYGRDYEERLTEAGFRVRRDSWVRELPRDTLEQHGLKREDVFFCDRV